MNHGNVIIVEYHTALKNTTLFSAMGESQKQCEAKRARMMKNT